LTHCPKNEERVFFIRKPFSGKCSIGQISSSFDNAAEKFLQSGRKNLTQCPKLTEKRYIFEKKTIPQNVVFDSAGETTFEDPCEIVCQGAQNLLLNFRR